MAGWGVRWLAPVAIAGLLLSGVAQGGSTSGRPDLVETAVSVSRRAVSPGALFRVADAVTNRGQAVAKRSKVVYFLLHGRTRLRLAVRLLGRLRPNETSRGATTALIPISAAGEYQVLACADGLRQIRESDEANNCRPAPAPVDVADRTPPAFAGLESAVTCIPGPVDVDRSARFRLKWRPAVDDVTPARRIAYAVYQSTTARGESFSAPTYTSPPGATSFTTPPLPASATYYFVVQATDTAGNRDANRAERTGTNLCL